MGPRRKHFIENALRHCNVLFRYFSLIVPEAHCLTQLAIMVRSSFRRNGALATYFVLESRQPLHELLSS
jgi:hypothetical protein